MAKAAGKRSVKARQAVVMVHGMGEPTPMETLRGFVDAAWTCDGGLDRRSGDVWINPTALTGSHEMRRIVTGGVKASSPGRDDLTIYTDFYELYWADCITGTSFDQLKDWFFALVLRRPGQVPRPVFGLWIGLLIALAGVVLFTLLKLVASGPFYNAALAIASMAVAGWALFTVLKPKPFRLVAGGAIVVLLAAWLASTAAAVAGAIVVGALALVGLIGTGFLLPYLGDVARYVRRKPPNIAGRQAIRERGLKLLKTLHEAEDGPGQPRYDRIVIVAHSLGSIVAFDLIAHLWSDREAARTFPSSDAAAKAALKKLESAVDALQTSPMPEARETFQQAQRALLAVMASAEPQRRWLISDFVTMGSPLTHADFLMARDEDDRRKRQQEREIPRCPPVVDNLWPNIAKERLAAGFPPIGPTPGFEPSGATPKTPCGLFYGVPDGSGRAWRLHHAAPFAAVRWTNLFDRPVGEDASLTGDLISGPVEPAFGAGVSDIRVTLGWPETSPLRERIFTHTEYWSMPSGSGGDHLAALRGGLDLPRRGFPAPPASPAERPAGAT